MSNLPKKFIESVNDHYGHESADFIDSIDLPPRTFLRVNPEKIQFDLSLGQIPWCKNGFEINKRPLFTMDPAFHAGGYYVQDSSSMFLEQIWKTHIGSEEPLRVLDLCASPGGKSTHLLSLMNDNSCLVSNEVIGSRASILRENIIKWGYSNVIITNSDPKAFGETTGVFDVVLVDAPCSGEGLFRKDLKAREEWSVSNVELCTARQQRILADVWPCLREGGVLIYSTCTFNRYENEDNLRWLSEQFDIEPLSVDLKESWKIEKSETGRVLGYKFLPHRVSGEGLFLSAVRKLEFERPIKTKGIKLHRKKIDLSIWIADSKGFETIDFDNQVNFCNSLTLETILLLKGRVRSIQSGFPVGVIISQKLKPSPLLPFSINLNQEVINLSYTESLDFLCKKEISIRDLEGERSAGWQIYGFQGLAFGLAKALPNRLNNYYPKEWRIRMSIEGREHFSVLDFQS